jgi:hypothetical protein
MAPVQTLFTNNDADERRSSLSRRWRGSIGAVGFGMWGVSGLVRRDIPFALAQFLLAILYLLSAMELLPERWPWPAEIGLCSVFSVVGVAEIRHGRTALGWYCCALAVVCIILVAVKRLRQPNDGHRAPAHGG